MAASSKGGTAVGASSLSHRQATEDAKREEDDGTAEAEECEVVLQGSNATGGATPYHHHLRCVGRLPGYHRLLLGRVVLGASGWCWTPWWLEARLLGVAGCRLLWWVAGYVYAKKTKMSIIYHETVLMVLPK